MTTVFLVAVAAFALGIAGALFAPGPASRALASAGAAVGALAAAALGACALLTDVPLAIVSPILPLTGLALRLDGLGGFFLVLIGVAGSASAMYGFGYAVAYDGRARGRMLGAMVNVLLLALTVQVMADNALTFLLAWEVMSLAAYFTVLTEHERAEAVRAANWYLAVTHVGFAAIVAIFFLLAPGDPSVAFGSMRGATLPSGVRHAVFLLALVGFGSKAGLVPLHVWLPMAHPVAPSHVSALMSGVVIKMGVYGFLRVVVDILGGGPMWWGALTLAVGAISAMVGILYALMDADLKRLLAFSSVENIGIVFIGLGTGLTLHAYGLHDVAALAFVGALYHSLNHACFKTLLFMGAGAVVHAVGTRSMEAAGGLIRRMPWTALSFLVGAAAIAALPPLNGFASEWLIFQSLLGTSAIPDAGVAAVMPVAVALLALTSGLAAACFVRAFGITFLAIPRSPAAEAAHEVAPSMRVPMLILAAACVLLGVGPVIAVPFIARALRGLPGLADHGATFVTGLTVEVGGGTTHISPSLLGVLLVTLLACVLVGLRLARADRRLRLGATWGCGRIGQTPRMQYTATAFAEPLRRIFAELYRPTEDLSVDHHPESRYFVRSIRYASDVRPWFETMLYAPVLGALRAVAGHVRWVQAGSLHLYLLYMTVGLLLLLLTAGWLP